MTEERSLHLLPSQGKPTSLLEQVSQVLVKILAYLPVYTAIVATLTFLAVVFGIPLLEGD